MRRRAFEPPDSYLKPGEIYASEEPALVTTVLGSCIAAVFFNPLAGGSICHALLPTGEGDRGSDRFRYLDCAMYWMIEWFGVRDVKPAGIEVKLFGGSEVLAPVRGHGRSESVGLQNIRKALKIIEKERLKLVAHDVGGIQGRKIRFNSGTGRVQLTRHNGIFRGQENRDPYRRFGGIPFYSESIGTPSSC